MCPASLPGGEIQLQGIACPRCSLSKLVSSCPSGPLFTIATQGSQQTYFPIQAHIPGFQAFLAFASSLEVVPFSYPPLLWSGYGSQDITHSQRCYKCGSSLLRQAPKTAQQYLHPLNQSLVNSLRCSLEQHFLKIFTFIKIIIATTIFMCQALC